MKTCQASNSINEKDIQNCQQIAELLTKLNNLRENSQDGNSTLVIPNSFQNNCFETGFLNYSFIDNKVIIKTFSEDGTSRNIKTYDFDQYHDMLKQELALKEWGIPILNNQHKIISELLCSSEILYAQEILHNHEGRSLAVTNLKKSNKPLWGMSFPIYEISTTSDETTIIKYQHDQIEKPQITLKTSEIIDSNKMQLKEDLTKKGFIAPETTVESANTKRLEQELSKSPT